MYLKYESGVRSSKIIEVNISIICSFILFYWHFLILPLLSFSYLSRLLNFICSLSYLVYYSHLCEIQPLHKNVLKLLQLRFLYLPHPSVLISNVSTVFCRRVKGEFLKYIFVVLQYYRKLFITERGANSDSSSSHFT